MPVTNDPAALRSLLNQKLANRKLSATEATAVVKEAMKDGVTEAEAQALVDELLAAQESGFDTAAVNNAKSINKLLGAIDKVTAVPLGDRGNAALQPNGKVDYASLLRQQSLGRAESLPQKTYGGRSLGVSRGGEVVVDGTAQRMNLCTPTDNLLEGLWGLSRPGQLAGLTDGAAKSLAGQLVAAVNQELAVPQQDPDKFARNAGAAASLCALAELAPRWDAATCDAMLDLAGRAPTVLMQGLVRRGLEAAPLNESQKARLAALPAASADVGELMKRFDEVRTEGAKIGWRNVQGQAAQLVLSAMVFAKKAEGVDNLLATLKVWDELNGGGIDSEELDNMRRVLSGYMQGSESMGVVFGTLAADAPKERAAILNARVVAQVEPELRAEPPSFSDTPLTREQADYVLTLLPNLRDTSAVNNMLSAMDSARSLFERSGYGQRPSAPMCEASFELFRRMSTEYQDAAAASPDGKLDYSDFSRTLRTEVDEIQTALRPRLGELRGASPKWNGVALSADAARFVEGLLKQSLRSGMSVENLGRAISIVGAANGNKIEGAAFAQLQKIVADYKAGWPEMEFFDFNKLERFASAAVAGKTVPLCMLDGKPVSVGEFYVKVGATVAKAVDPSKMLHAWQTERWGMTAKELVEILDVVAEQAARGEGPVALLRQTYPKASIEIQATGADGCHEQFVYVVKNGAETLKFTQGSDGAVARYQKTPDPILFTATIGAEGALNVNVPKSISTRRYPLQNSYGVGDRVDISYQDTQAVELQEEGKSFSTKWKVLEAEIVAFDAVGNYTVRYTTPAGQQETKTVSLSDIRKANNPHYFKPTGSTFSDVTINITNDAELKAFIDGAQPIIAKHLPTDGSLLSLTPQQLARRQKDCIAELQRYAASKVDYPDEGANADANSKRYHELTADAYSRIPLGELVKVGRGVCRHQCILEHLLLQYAGIDSRLASGAANTSGNAFRGFHIWTEVTLADNERYLSDQTWSDSAIPLWRGAYSVDKRRLEMYDRTARYDSTIVN